MCLVFHSLLSQGHPIVFCYSPIRMDSRIARFIHAFGAFIFFYKKRPVVSYSEFNEQSATMDAEQNAVFYTSRWKVRSRGIPLFTKYIQFIYITSCKSQQRHSGKRPDTFLFEMWLWHWREQRYNFFPKASYQARPNLMFFFWIVSFLQYHVHLSSSLETIAKRSHRAKFRWRCIEN